MAAKPDVQMQGVQTRPVVYMAPPNSAVRRYLRFYTPSPLAASSAAHSLATLVFACMTLSQGPVRFFSLGPS